MVLTDNCQEKTDEELVVLTLADQENFLCLMKRYEPKLLAYIKRITSISHEEAEDVLQETFIKTYLNLNNFDPDLKFSSWIYRIAHNEVINNYRKSKARPSLINFEDNDVFIKSIASDLNLVSEMDSKILKEGVKKVLNEIDPKYREVLILKFLEEKDYREISDILAKPMGTIATLINRAKKQFKEKLQEQKYQLLNDKLTRYN